MKYCAVLILIAVLSMPAFAADEFPVNDAIPDRELFEALNLEFEGMQGARAAYEADDIEEAKHALAEYLRARTIKTWRFDPHQFSTEVPHGASSVAAAERMLNHQQPFTDDHWDEDGTFRWNYQPNAGNKARQYFFTALGRAYWASGRDERIAKLWTNMLRSWLRQCPKSSEQARRHHWNTLVVGIHMRGWPNAFHYFLHSPSFADEDIILYLKSTIQQARHLRENHRQTGNWLTFSMVGLYTSGVVFPELKEAAEWRTYAVKTARADLKRGYLPDGMGVELSPGYHNLFYNYLRICDLAEDVGRDENPGIRALAQKGQKLFEPYIALCAPDRTMPKYQDGGLVDVTDRMKEAFERYPDREDCQWFATEEKAGTKPDFTSTMLPYAGYFAMRSGWGRDANYLGFDAGPIGWKHCHSDKLNVVMWSHGRLLLFDPGVGTYDDEPLANWARDTFAHSTVLVDNRPQRRRWSTPNPNQMPYQKLDDIRWDTDESRDIAYGVYDKAYGIQGPSDPYPYWDDSDYRNGWVNPATHHRRIFYLKPDIFVVADTLQSKDGRGHEYDLRWQILSTSVSTDPQTKITATEDERQPNVAIVPLLTESMETHSASAQMEPQIMGWKYYKEPEPATTLQQIKSGDGTVQFVTLLLPLEAGQICPVTGVEVVSAHTMKVAFADGRALIVTADPDPSEDIEVNSVQ